MALWEPDQLKVGKNESIGRRLFHRQPLKGAQDQRRPENTFELYHFEETRDRNVSVDRLGASSIDGKVKSYLMPRCHDAADRMHKKPPFLGWAVTRAKEFQAPAKGKPLNVAPSPMVMQVGNDLSENRYHAHIEMLPEYDSHEMALRLQYIFERNYHLEPCTVREGGFLSWLISLFKFK